jgi:hypothetical protein
MFYKMISNKKLVNYKILEIIKIYNFRFGHLFTWLGLDNSNFEFQKITTSNKILKHQMISAEKVINNKAVELIKMYNFYFDHFFIWQSDINIVHNFYIISRMVS